MVKVELVYLPKNKEGFHRTLEVEEGSSVKAVIEKSSLLEVFPNLSLDKVGIYSKLVSLDTIVHSGDRVEIYRPLEIDPKERRRKQAMKS